MRRGAWLLAALLLAGAAIAANAANAAAGIAGPAPDFTRSDLAGKPVSLAGYRGKVVLLNFWATWCGPCLEELPTFARWQQQYGGAGLRIIGVSMDDDAKPVQKFLARQPVGYPVVMGDTQLARTYGGVLGLPVTYLIDADGNVASHYLGETDLKAMEAKIKALLPH